MNSRRLLLAGVGTLAGLAAAALLALRPRGGSGAGAEFLLPEPIPAPDLQLTTHTGATARLSELGEGRVLAVFFGYTNCPDICPTTLADLGRARALLGADSARVQTVLVSVDPRRDTPTVLSEYLARFPGGAIGLTGSEEEVAAAAKAFLSYAAPPPPDHEHGAAGYLVDHTARTLVVRDGRIVMTFPPQTPARQMADGLALALRR